MGIDPNLTIFPFTKELVYPDKAALLRGEYARLEPGTFDPDRAEAVLLHHFTQGADGAYSATAAFRGALLDWRPHEALKYGDVP